MPLLSTMRAQRRRPAVGKDQPADGDVGRARADESDLDLANLLAHHLERVDQPGQRDACGALLVVVPDGNLALGAQRVQDVEALGLRNVFQVHAAQPGLQQLDDFDDLFRVFAVYHQRKAVHAAQVFVEQRLAFHHRHAGFGADVAHAQHARAVGHNRDGVPLVGVLVHLLRVVANVQARLGNAGRVPDGKIVKITHAALERRLDLAFVERVKPERIGHRLSGLGFELLDGGLMNCFRHTILL